MIQSTLLAAIDAAFQAAVKAEVESQLTGIRQHFANTVGELAAKVAALEEAAPEFDAEAIAQLLSEEQLRQIGRRVSPNDIAASVDWSEVIDYSELAGSIEYSELAGEITVNDIADALDLDARLRQFLAGRSITIQL